MTKPRPAPVPQTRLGRLARIGFAAGELAVGAATQGIMPAEQVRRVLHRERRGQRRGAAAALQHPAARHRHRGHRRGGQAPALAGGRLRGRGAAAGELREARRRRAEAPRAARALGPHHGARHGHGLHGRRAARERALGGARDAQRRRHAPRAPALPRALRVPRHADRPELRQLPLPPRGPARRAARFRRDAQRACGTWATSS